MILGCIADDFTGATDLANNLVRAGMRVVQTIGVPTTPAAEAGPSFGPFDQHLACFWQKLTRNEFFSQDRET
jgi:hypothetical protein